MVYDGDGVKSYTEALNHTGYRLKSGGVVVMVYMMELKVIYHRLQTKRWRVVVMVYDGV